MVSNAVVDFRVERECSPCGSRSVDSYIPSVRLAALSYDVDDTHVAFGFILGGGCGKNLNVLDAGSANHLQGLSTGKGRWLAIDIDQELLTAAKGETSVCINCDTRHSSQHIKGCSTLSGHYLRSVNPLPVEAIANTLPLSVDVHLAHHGSVGDFGSR